MYNKFDWLKVPKELIEQEIIHIINYFYPNIPIFKLYCLSTYSNKCSFIVVYFYFAFNHVIL